MTTEEDDTRTAASTADHPLEPRGHGRPQHLGWSVAVQLADLVLPLVAYYTLRAFGASVWTALVVPSILTGMFILHRWVRQRTIDELSVFVFAILVVSVAVSAWSGSPRFLLAKGAFFSAGIGMVFLGSLFGRRPFAFTLTRGLIERVQIPTADWDELWHAEPRFRRGWRACTAIWGVGLLIDAGVLAVFAYRLPIDSVPALTTALRLGSFAILQIITNTDLARRGMWKMLDLDVRTLWRRRDSPAQ